MHNPVIIHPTFEPAYTDELMTEIGAYPEDAPVVDRHIRTARQLMEKRTGRAYATQTRDLVIDHFPRTSLEIQLPGSPIQSVTHLKYYDADGVEQTILAADFASHDIIVNTEGLPGSIYAKCGWPCTDGRPGGVSVRYVCGYGDGECPGEIIQCIHFLVSHWFDNRNPVLIGSISKNLEFTITNMEVNYRVRCRPIE